MELFEVEEITHIHMYMQIKATPTPHGLQFQFKALILLNVMEPQCILLLIMSSCPFLYGPTRTTHIKDKHYNAALRIEVV